MLQARMAGVLTTVEVPTMPQIDPKDQEDKDEALYSSFVPYTLPDTVKCAPVLAVKKDSIHYKRLLSTKIGNFVVTQIPPKGRDPEKLPLTRVAIVGETKEISGDEKVAALDHFDTFQQGSKKTLEAMSDNLALLKLTAQEILMVRRYVFFVNIYVSKCS
jgi:hypothetical protein